jgi:hypothetical protein
MLGTAARVWLVRPTTSQLTAAVLLMMTFWPCILVLPATLQETLHCAIALVLAGIAHQNINKKESRVWLFVAAVTAASFVRVQR